MKVEERMTRNPATVNVKATALEVAKKMKSENLGTVLVIDNGRLKGIVTDRQIATKVVAAGKDPAKISVSEFMTKNPVTCSPGMEVCEASKIMGERGYRRIPVVEREKPVGIISVVDVAGHAKACNACMESLFAEMEKARR